MGNYDMSAAVGQKMTLKRIQERMDEFGINKAKLAEKSGINKGTISKYFAETQEMGLKNYFKICGALELRPYLIPAELDNNEIVKTFFN